MGNLFDFIIATIMGQSKKSDLTLELECLDYNYDCNISCYMILNQSYHHLDP